MSADLGGRIQHVVLLMLENRSFDHLVGTLPGVDGVLDDHGQPRTDLVNYADPSDPTSKRYGVILGAQAVTPKNEWTDGGYGGPSHTYYAASEQLFGVKDVKLDDGSETAPYYGTPPKMYPPDLPVGFIKSFAAELWGAYKDNGTSLEAEQEAAAKEGREDPVNEVMEVFTADQLPAIHTLATEFCVCDRWFSEVPGPTEPNRLFTHAGTSTGLTYNPWGLDPIGAPTIYERLDAAGRSWGMYGFDLYDATNFSALADRPEGLKTFDDFVADVNSGELPFYSFICPRYADAGLERANSQHAPYDVRYGDKLIADVYNTLRASGLWEGTLLIITYDEHGGYYDHVIPPSAPRPDSSASPNAYMQAKAESNPDRYGYLTEGRYIFDFDHLGFRVPAVLVSPLIPRGTIDHTDYRHTSVLRFLADLVGTEPLTERDRTANSFASVLSLPAPRPDCPPSVPSAALPAPDPELMLRPPPAKQVESVRRYTSLLQGHPDSGQATARQFKTRGELASYIQDRNRRARWHRTQSQRGARFEVYEDASQRWRWRLREGSGDITVASTDSYDSREAVDEALERARFLGHVLGSAEEG